ncbi:carbonate dehydratase [Burkholderia sp. Ac-20379]|uniref:carbonate dehydratase n=1 Tax=Burkholderia sp. Ac-20379 TaxID=2703900 RepID=UPI00198227EB|nr:carbonate dehydratase [Burkholderia sp. Ac-20379]MBN3724938.1 carbonate dehydratase [Burkholderia sp. Ac-20379]
MNATTHPLSHLFDNNEAWVKRKLADDPQFFERLKDQQAPEYLWIGCSDSRVPANQIIGLPPGEVFVHRNIANVVVHTDLNCLSVLQFAVDILKVKHIMVVGHYGCSGVNAALTNRRVGLADNWLHHVQDVRDRHAALLDEWPVGEARYRRLIELNAIEQVVNVCRTTIVNDAWSRGQPLTVHGLVYGVHDGRMRNLGMAVSSPEEQASVYQRCVEALSAGRARGEENDNDMVTADAAKLADVAEQVANTLKETKHDNC